MQVFGIKFNLANIWGLPLIIGTAAEFGLNVIVSHLEVRAHPGGPLIARSAVMGVMLNGITTMVGFGSLMIAAHQGIFGLGLLLTLGSLCGLRRRARGAAGAAAAGARSRDRGAGGGGGEVVGGVAAAHRPPTPRPLPGGRVGTLYKESGAAAICSRSARV